MQLPDPTVAVTVELIDDHVKDDRRVVHDGLTLVITTLDSYVCVTADVPATAAERGDCILGAITTVLQEVLVIAPNAVIEAVSTRYVDPATAEKVHMTHWLPEDEQNTLDVLEQIIATRKSRMGQTELMKRMGNYSRARVKDLERGDPKMQIPTLQRYARAVGLRVKLVLVEDPDFVPPKDPHAE